MSINATMMDLFLTEVGVPPKVQQQVVGWFLDTYPAPSPNSCTDLGLYFQYYAKQICQALHNDAQHISADRHQDILSIGRHFKDGVSKDVIKQRLASQYHGPRPDIADHLCEGSVDLAVRALLMIDIGELQNGFCGRRLIFWERGTVQDFLHRAFPSNPVLSAQGVKLGSIFLACNLERITGVKIVWTTNLADHLRMIDEDKKLFIFHHASFLQHQQHSIFPKGLIDETIRTLMLLFPKGHKFTETWYRKIASVETLDPCVLQCGCLRADDRQFERFMYWRDRLLILKQVFDESRPSTLSQWWNDRRNGVQWYTFWVAILVLLLTIFFGLVQSIEGALQVYKAYHPTPL